jgi:tRNA threonylcarbamoyladenosine biosynthesis protein TsaE
VQLKSAGPGETIVIGKKLGQRLKKGDVVCLYGDIGAGKTTLIKGIASSFGIHERDITSASFTMIAEYDTSPPFYHVDLYRLEGGKDVDNIGMYDYLGSDGIAVIEWAERLDDVPDGALRITIEIIDENRRKLYLEGFDEKDWNNM